MFESVGFLRNLGALVSSVGAVLKVVPVPQLQVWGETILLVGAIIGGTGVTRAALVGNLEIKKTDN
jgi:hypothetical protein